MVVGATVLLATVIHDAGVAGGAWTTGYLADAGIVAFVVGIATTPSARYALVALALERRTDGSLRAARTRELRRSYEELRAWRSWSRRSSWRWWASWRRSSPTKCETRWPSSPTPWPVCANRPSRARIATRCSPSWTRRPTASTGWSPICLRYTRPGNVQRAAVHALRASRESHARSGQHGQRRSIKIELKVECHEGRIWGDANLLRQVFDNLVDNGVQAMGATGRSPCAYARPPKEDRRSGGRHHRHGRGHGHPGPFARARPVLHHAAERHRPRAGHRRPHRRRARPGHFAIDSRSGEGTTVTVFLPHGSSSEPPPPRTRPPKPPSDPRSPRPCRADARRGPFTRSEGAPA